MYSATNNRTVDTNNCGVQYILLKVTLNYRCYSKGHGFSSNLLTMITVCLQKYNNYPFCQVLERENKNILIPDSSIFVSHAMFWVSRTGNFQGSKCLLYFEVEADKRTLILQNIQNYSARNTMLCPKDLNLLQHHCDNLKSRMFTLSPIISY
jgi:hypothetical protein